MSVTVIDLSTQPDISTKIDSIKNSLKFRDMLVSDVDEAYIENIGELAFGNLSLITPNNEGFNNVRTTIEEILSSIEGNPYDLSSIFLRVSPDQASSSTNVIVETPFLVIHFGPGTIQTTIEEFEVSENASFLSNSAQIDFDGYYESKSLLSVSSIDEQFVTSLGTTAVPYTTCITDGQALKYNLEYTGRSISILASLVRN